MKFTLRILLQTVLYKQPISKLVFVLLGSFHVELLESCHERLKEEFIFSRFFLVFIHLDTKWHTALSGLEHYDWLFTFSFSLSGTATMNLLESKNTTGPWKWASLKTGPAFWGIFTPKTSWQDKQSYSWQQQEFVGPCYSHGLFNS